MKKTIINIIILIAFVLSSCVASSSSAKVIGTWRDNETPSFELEFTRDGRFIEYFFGEQIGYGEYHIDGSKLYLHYLSNCGEDEGISCNVTLAFTATEDTLIITDSEGDLIFKKSE